MSKKYNTGAPKRRVIVAAQQEVKKRVHKAELRGLRRGRRLGTHSERMAFANTGFLGRLKAAFTGSYVQE